MLLAALLVFWANSFIPAGWFACSASDTACLGGSVVTRLSFVFTVFHLVLIAVLFTHSHFANVLHEECWCLKLLMLTLSFLGSFWLPNSYIASFLKVSRIMGAIFLLY